MIAIAILIAFIAVMVFASTSRRVTNEGAGYMVIVASVASILGIAMAL